MINNMIALRGSTKNLMSTLKFPTVNQLKISFTKMPSSPNCLASYTSLNTPQLSKKDVNITPQPIIEINGFGKVFRNNPTITNPKKGINGMAQINSIISSFYLNAFLITTLFYLRILYPPISYFYIP